MIPSGGPARLETTPAEPPFLSSEAVTVEGTVDELGKITAHTRMVLRGDSEMYMRYMFRRTPKGDWKSLGFYLSMAGGLPGEVTDIKATDPADLEKPFEVEFNVSRKDFLDWSSKKLKVPLPFPSFSLNPLYGRTSKSKKPLEIGPPIDVSYSLKLTIPAKYQSRLPLPLFPSCSHSADSAASCWYAPFPFAYRVQRSCARAEASLFHGRVEIPLPRRVGWFGYSLKRPRPRSEPMSFLVHLLIDQLESFKLRR